MGDVGLDISMSLDGLVTGPNVGIEHPLGEDGGRLHDWMLDRGRSGRLMRRRDEQA
jgi:hypothetical protein